MHFTYTHIRANLAGIYDMLEIFDENHVILCDFTEGMVEELTNRYSDPWGISR